MERILVTGGAGFLGSHLCARLLNEGHDVLCLDNFYTGSKRNLIKHIGNPHFEVLRHDIVEPIRLEVDRIYNLACPASPVHYQNNPVATTKTSVSGVLNMLGLAKRINIPLLQASTSEVYGDPLVHPQQEDYWGNVNPYGVRACYDEGKRCAEALCFDYNRQHGLEVKIARIFNTYGPNMNLDDGRVISTFMVQALRGEPLTVAGEGRQTRSFCYVDDLIEGLIRLMHTDPDCSKPVNLGSPVEITILDLAKRIIAATGSSSEIRFIPSAEDDPNRRCPDISRAKELLGWQPTTMLDEGLSKTATYFKEVLAAGV